MAGHGLLNIRDSLSWEDEIRRDSSEWRRMPQLIQLIYSSAAKHLFSPDELTELLQNARHKNMRHGVTGILLYTDGSFFQVLEGEETIVDDIFASISRDERHKQVTVIIREPIAKRSFGDWTMGYADISAPGGG